MEAKNVPFELSGLQKASQDPSGMKSQSVKNPGGFQSSGPVDGEIHDNMLQSDVNHVQSDVDSSKVALHHTIGISQNQVSAGTHIHDGIDSRRLGEMGAQVFAPATGSVIWYGSVTPPVLNNGLLFSEVSNGGGGLTYFTFKLIIGSTTTFGAGFYGFTLPFNVLGNTGYAVTGHIKNGAGDNYFPCEAIVRPSDNSVTEIKAASGKTEGSPWIGSGGWKAGWAAGDEIFFSGIVPT